MKKKTLVLLFLVFAVIGTGKSQTLTRLQVDSVVANKANLLPGKKDLKLSLEVAVYYISKEGALKVNLDSAASFIAKASSLKLSSAWSYGYIFFVEALLQKKRGDVIRAKNLLSKSIVILEKEGDKGLLGRAYYELSRYYLDLYDDRQFNLRVSLVEKAVKLLAGSPDKSEYAADLLMLADLYAISGKFRKSIPVLYQCLQINQSIHNKRLQGVYILLGKNYSLLTDYNNGLKYGLLAEKTCYETGDTTQQLCQVENSLGLTYNFLGKLDLAIKHFRLGLAVAEKNKDAGSIIAVVNNLCGVYLSNHQAQKVIKLLNQYAPLYVSSKSINVLFNQNKLYLNANVELKNFREAKLNFELYKNQIKSPEIPSYDAQVSYPGIINYLLIIKNYREAEKYGQLYLDTAENIHDIYMRRTAYKLAYMVDSAKLNYKSAFMNSLRYKSLNDSIFSEKKSRQIEDLEFVYKTKEKDDAIAYLHQSAKLQTAELNKSKRQTSETIAGIIILLLGGGVFARHYSIKKKAYKIIEDQNGVISIKNFEIGTKNLELTSLVHEKEYLLMEVHHRVKNNLNTVLSFLSLQSGYLKGDALAAITISRQRIYAMSLIHQKFYLADDIKTIDIKSYLNEFIDYFKDSLSPKSQILFKLQIDNLRIPVTKAIPICLIINEAITNSAKYAFPDNKKGKIVISMLRNDGFVELTISDDGVGMSKDINLSEFDSLGIKLIKGLTNDLDGTIVFDSHCGVKIEIKFPAET